MCWPRFGGNCPFASMNLRCILCCCALLFVAVIHFFFFIHFASIYFGLLPTAFVSCWKSTCDIVDRNDFCIDVILREIAVYSIFSYNMIDVWKMQGKNCDKVVRNMFFLLIHSFLHTNTHSKANIVISSLTIDACKSRQLRVSIYLLLFR